MSRAAILTIGNFDGVHRGHQALLLAARELAATSAASGVEHAIPAMAASSRERPRKGAARQSPIASRSTLHPSLDASTPSIIALVFDPHPATVLRPDRAPQLISRILQRVQWLRQAGADDVRTLRPDPSLLSLTPEQFVQRIVDEYHPAAIVEGTDFRFGRNRSGSIESLATLGAAHGFQTIAVEPVSAALTDHSIVRVSSTMIRWLLARGRVRDAAALLGRPFELQSTVVRGEQRGRRIGFPTANLAECGQILPADGIYSGVAVRPDEARFPAAISVGTKPTFGSLPRVCEAHLVGFDGALDEYDWPIRLELHEWIRDQIQFRDAAGLIEQIRRDVQCVAERSPMEFSDVECSPA